MPSNQLANRVGFRTFRSNHGCSRLLVRMCSRLAFSGGHDMAASVTTASSNTMSGERLPSHLWAWSERIARHIPIKNGSPSGCHHSLRSSESVLKSHNDSSLGISFLRATFMRFDLVSPLCSMPSWYQKLQLR